MSAPALATVESWEDHVEAWHHLGREVDGAAWARAAIAASLKGRYGDGAVEKFAAEVGFSGASVRHFARTFEAFPKNQERSQNLTFSHHLLAAKLTKDAAQAKAALADAEREGWSANALRAHLRPAPELPEASAPTCETEEGSCGPATPADKMMHVSLLIHGFNKLRDYDADSLVKQGTKKSLRELSGQIEAIVEWLESFRTAIKGRL